MSLTNEQFMEAIAASREMDERLTKLFGFSPATSNHYGRINIYNVEINRKTTDERLLDIRAKYVNWKTGILKIFAEYGFEPEYNHLCEMFRSDPMFGTLEFLEIPVDIEKSPEAYRDAIVGYLRANNLIADEKGIKDLPEKKI